MNCRWSKLRGSLWLMWGGGGRRWWKRRREGGGGGRGRGEEGDRGSAGQGPLQAQRRPQQAGTETQGGSGQNRSGGVVYSRPKSFPGSHQDHACGHVRGQPQPGILKRKIRGASLAAQTVKRKTRKTDVVVGVAGRGWGVRCEENKKKLR